MVWAVCVDLLLCGVYSLLRCVLGAFSCSVACTEREETKAAQVRGSYGESSESREAAAPRERAESFLLYFVGNGKLVDDSQWLKDR